MPDPREVEDNRQITAEDRFQQAVKKWLYRKGHVSEGVDDVIKISIDREDSWSGDAGTWWPPETNVYFYEVMGDRIFNKTVSAPADITQFLTELLDD